MMKKISTIAILTFLFIPLFSYAQTDTSTSNPYGTLVPLSSPQATPPATPPPPNVNNTNNTNQNTGNGNLSYTPLETLPGMTPGATPDLPSYLAIVFKLLIVVGALIAVGALAVSGLTIMFSEVSGKLTAAKSRAQAAVWGLVIIAASYLFLQTINPQLVSFNFLPGNVAVTGAQPSLFSQTPTNQPPCGNQFSNGCPANYYCGKELLALSSTPSDYCIANTNQVVAQTCASKGGSWSNSILGTFCSLPATTQQSCEDPSVGGTWQHVWVIYYACVLPSS